MFAIGISLKGHAGGRGTSHGGSTGSGRVRSQAGGVNSSSGRSYSASNPSFSNSRDFVSLPVQYAHTQTSVPENSPTPEPQRHPPHFPASSPTSDDSYFPTEHNPHQTLNQNPSSQPPQNPVTLDDLLAIPRRENYLPVLSPVPKDEYYLVKKFTLFILNLDCVWLLYLL
ncbi:hypothetical protein Bca52824_064957 [Brassica carinata]|uniref:Uncharacterized protein n=2 Tax=Brassica TaxID=3705 RepID=A0A8X7QJE7_BRACI|nr:hypothetical protein Bca52824_064957 [Brassica carinata]